MSIPESFAPETGLAPPDEPMLAIRGLTKRRGDASSSFELCVDSFRVGPGELIAVVGASGCGKSTLLDILALILDPDAAESFQLKFPRYQAVEAAQLTSGDRTDVRRRFLGYVLQSGGLLDFLTIQQNIALPARANGMGNAKQRARELARELGIADQLHKKPRHLSGGQRQRAAIARALAHDPALVLADEPTAALDPHRARALMNLFREEITRRNIGLVMVTHDFNLIRGLANRVYSFRLEDHTPNHIRSRCFEVPRDQIATHP